MTGFNLDIARAMARASELAYIGQLGEVDDTFGLRVIDFDRTGTVCLLAWGRDAVFAFAGSHRALDYVEDALCWLMVDAFSGGRVHHGADLHFQALWPWLQAQATIPGMRPDRQFYVTGHSLGGAMCPFAAVRLTSLEIPLGPVYTFGEFRSGDAQRAKDYQLEHYRVVDDIDIAPHYPAGWSWRHVGTEVTLSGEGEHYTVGTTWLQGIGHLFARFYRAPLDTAGASLTDHSIVKYREALNRCRAAEGEGEGGGDDQERRAAA